MSESEKKETPESVEESSFNDEGVEVLCKEGDEKVGEHLTFRVGNNLKFRRLDKYLGGRFNNFSRSRLQKLIKTQGVNVNGRPAKTSHKLNAGDEIDLVLPARELRELIPEDIPLDIIYEDDEMIVLNKQANLIVHPARGYKNGTLVNALVFHANQLSEGTEDFRPGIVHRLDKNTTGVMVVAKTDNAHWKLSRQFAERTTQKTYLAVVQGVPELSADCINKPLGVHPSAREKYAIRPGGKDSISFYDVLEEFRGYSLLKLSPKTGRTHQLRVHMQYIKHSIVADDMYGGKMVYPWQIEGRECCPEEPLMGRVALHAWKLKIKHPVTDEEQEWEADPPADIQNFIENLRKYRKISEGTDAPKKPLHRL
jgi:23S rRNA pseudouridine1911/1915/1917 synthase